MSTVSLLEENRTRSVTYINDDDESEMKKIILVYGLPGPQASSVCASLVGNPLFFVRGVFNKDCPQVATFQEMGVEAEILDLNDKGPISTTRLKHIFRDVYGAFIVSNDADPPLVMRREMEVGMKIGEICDRMKVKHVIFSALDFVYRITGTRCPRYDSKGEIENKMKALKLPLTVLKLPMSYEYLVNTLVPSKQGQDLVFTGITESNRYFDVMNYGDVGPVVKMVFERPNIFIGKSIGLAVDRIDLETFVETMSQMMSDTKWGWRYEQATIRDYQKDKRNNRELAGILDFHCNYAPLRDKRTTQALNPNVQTFPEYVKNNEERIRKLFRVS